MRTERKRRATRMKGVERSSTRVKVLLLVRLHVLLLLVQLLRGTEGRRRIPIEECERMLAERTGIARMKRQRGMLRVHAEHTDVAGKGV